jgi:hypothetical protein
LFIISPLPAGGHAFQSHPEARLIGSDATDHFVTFAKTY